MQEKAEFIPEQPIEENKNVDTKKTHKWWYIVLLVSLVCLYTIMVAFNVVGSLSGGSNRKSTLISKFFHILKVLSIILSNTL